MAQIAEGVATGSNADSRGPNAERSAGCARTQKKADVGRNKASVQSPATYHPIPTHFLTSLLPFFWSFDPNFGKDYASSHQSTVNVSINGGENRWWRAQIGSVTLLWGLYCVLVPELQRESICKEAVMSQVVQRVRGFTSFVPRYRG